MGCLAGRAQCSDFTTATGLAAPYLWPREKTGREGEAGPVSVTRTKENTSERAVRLRSDGTWEDLQSSTANSWVTSINYFGDTVGSGAATGIGFIHYAGKLYSLRDLIVNPPANLKYVNPNVITDGGQICGGISIQNPDGTGSYSAVILTPVP